MAEGHEALNLGLAYVGGMRAPVPDQIGYVAIVDETGFNIKYVPHSQAGAVSHLDLTDRDQDDHPAYAKIAGDRPFLAPQAGVAAVDPDDLTTKAQLDAVQAIAAAANSLATSADGKADTALANAATALADAATALATANAAVARAGDSMTGDLDMTSGSRVLLAGFQALSYSTDQISLGVNTIPFTMLRGVQVRVVASEFDVNEAKTINAGRAESAAIIDLGTATIASPVTIDASGTDRAFLFEVGEDGALVNITAPTGMTGPSQVDVVARQPVGGGGLAFAFNGVTVRFSEALGGVMPTAPAGAGDEMHFSLYFETGKDVAFQFGANF